MRTDGIIASFDGDDRFLSNFFECPNGVFYDGIQYRNSEAAYQAAKLIDPKHRTQFRDMRADQAKSAGKKIDLRPDWKQVRLPIMVEIIHSKFTQNKPLRLQLIATAPLVLVEGNNWGDVFWGVDIKAGRGENWLGKLLMAERAYWIELDRIANTNYGRAA